MVFAKEEPLTISDYLKNIERNHLISIAIRLIYSHNKFCGFKDYCENFFCEGNRDFANICFRSLQNHLQEYDKEITNLLPRSYIIISRSTALELLRQTFAIKACDFVENISQEIQEQSLFKAILLINQMLSQWQVPVEYDSNGNETKLYIAKAFLCTTLDYYENTILKDEYLAMIQIIKGYHFFNYCENSKLKKHLAIFLENNGTKNWQQYLYNAIRLILRPLQNNVDNFPIIRLLPHREGEKFLQTHSFKEDNVIALADNKDYTFFKTYPLIEMKNGSYLPINATFCINRLYRSVYFEFRAINDTLMDTPDYLKGQGLLRIVTTEFLEQELFVKYVRNTLYGHGGIKLSENDCKQIQELGHEPDFYFRDGNNIILFENKDIKISDKAISSKDYAILEDEIQKKLVEKGIKQLIYNIKQIDNKTFKWDLNIPNNPKIYPILVIDDSSLCVPGLNYILNEEFKKQLKENRISINVYPLVIVELDTLIAFENYFQSKNVKFRKILDNYYDYISKCKKPQKIEQIAEEVFHKYFPFYIFMSKMVVKNPFNNNIYKNVCEELQEKIDSNTTDWY